MSLEEARALGLRLFDAGLTPYICDSKEGYYLSFIIGGKKYEIKKNENFYY